VQSLGDGDKARLEFPVTCQQVGSAVLSASLPSDELPGDNVVYLKLDAKEALRVLVIDGRPNVMDPADSESFYFAMAADPGREDGDGVKLDVLGAGDMALARFDDYDLVALLNVPTFPSELDADGERIYPKLEELEQYVAAGGGLVIYTGDLIDDSFYNGPFFKGGAGLSPFRIGPPEGDPNRWEDYFRLSPDSIDQSNPVVSIFRGEGRVLTRFIRFFAFTPAEEIVVETSAEEPTDVNAGEDDIGPPRVLARFTDPDNSPAIVTRQFGRSTSRYAGGATSDFCATVAIDGERSGLIETTCPGLTW
jgi:hypothetical protein